MGRERRTTRPNRGGLEEPFDRFLVRYVRRVRDAILNLVESGTSWRRAKRAIDREFDSTFGVDTGGVTYLSGLRIDSPRREHGVSHIAIEPREMNAALASLAIDHARFTFVDLGAGKGRALLMASLHPFRRIIGVEFARELHRIAEANVRRFVHPDRRCRDIELVHADAATFELPDEPLVVFMYNPFGAEVMRDVAERIASSVRRAPREVYVLYANPLAAEVFTSKRFVEVARGDAYLLLTPPPC